MDKVIPMSKKVSPEAREEARFLASLVYECLPVLVPKADVAERRKLAGDILSLLKGRRERMTPGLISELLRIHASFVQDQEGRCPLLVSTSSLCWEINNAIGCGNEEDKAFKRHDPTCAARPLTVGFDREEK